MQINKDNIRENDKRADHNYKVRDKFKLTNNTAYKYEMSYNAPFVITQCWINGTFTLQWSAIKIRHNICRINPYTSDTNVEDINT